MIELLLPFFTHTVTVPALRYRIEDIEVLVPFLLRELTSAAGVRLAPDAMRQLSKLPWPGSVAQLRRVVAETIARQRSGVIGADKLQAGIAFGDVVGGDLSQDAGSRHRLIRQRSLQQGGSRIRHGDETESFATLMRQRQDSRSESGLTITEREI
jgi:DNA-binding NtrC family response regulator